jgi:transcription termination factor Rho
MDRTLLEKKALAELREIASTLELRGYQRMKKADLVDLIIDAGATAVRRSASADAEAGNGRRRRRRRRDRAKRGSDAAGRRPRRRGRRDGDAGTGAANRRDEEASEATVTTGRVAETT